MDSPLCIGCDRIPDEEVLSSTESEDKLKPVMGFSGVDEGGVGHSGEEIPSPRCGS